MMYDVSAKLLSMTLFLKGFVSIAEATAAASAGSPQLHMSSSAAGSGGHQQPAASLQPAAGTRQSGQVILWTAMRAGPALLANCNLAKEDGCAPAVDKIFGATPHETSFWYYDSSKSFSCNWCMSALFCNTMHLHQCSYASTHHAQQVSSGSLQWHAIFLARHAPHTGEAQSDGTCTIFLKFFMRGALPQHA